MTIQEINQLICDRQKEVAKCPCCLADAQLVTYDYMTFTIQCKAVDCRLKVERGVVNERGPRRCIDMILTAWNRRATAQTRIGKLVEAAESAADWLCDTHKGSDQHERGVALRKQLKHFGR